MRNIAGHQHNDKLDKSGRCSNPPKSERHKVWQALLSMWLSQEQPNPQRQMK